MTSFDHNTDAEAVQKVLAERDRQVRNLGYTSELDDRLSLSDWSTKLDHYSALALHAAIHDAPGDFRWRVVELAATAVACIASLDRKLAQQAAEQEEQAREVADRA